MAKIIILGLVVIVLVVAVFVLLRLTRNPAATASGTFVQPAATDAELTELDIALQTHYPQLWPELSQDAREAELDLYTLSSDILHSLSPDVAAAPDDAILTLIDAHEALARQLAKEDPKACVYFSAYGPQDVETYSPTSRALLHRLGATILNVADQGETNATPRLVTLRSAVDQLHTAMKAQGVPAEDLVIDLDNPPSDEWSCAHSLRIYETLNRLPPADAARIFVGMNYLID